MTPRPASRPFWTLDDAPVSRPALDATDLPGEPANDVAEKDFTRADSCGEAPLHGLPTDGGESPRSGRTETTLAAKRRTRT